MPLNPDFIAQFKAEVQRSLLLEDSDKQYWTTNTATLPESLINYFYNLIKAKNKLIDSYIQKAIEQKPELVAEFKNKITKLKKDLLKLEEKESSTRSAEEILEQELKNL